MHGLCSKCFREKDAEAAKQRSAAAQVNTALQTPQAPAQPAPSPVPAPSPAPEPQPVASTSVEPVAAAPAAPKPSTTRCLVCNKKVRSIQPSCGQLLLTCSIREFGRCLVSGGSQPSPCVLRPVRSFLGSTRCLFCLRRWASRGFLASAMGTLSSAQHIGMQRHTTARSTTRQHSVSSWRRRTRWCRQQS